MDRGRGRCNRLHKKTRNGWASKRGCPVLLCVVVCCCVLLCVVVCCCVLLCVVVCCCVLLCVVVCCCVLLCVVVCCCVCCVLLCVVVCCCVLLCVVVCCCVLLCVVVCCCVLLCVVVCCCVLLCGRWQGGQRCRSQRPTLGTHQCPGTVTQGCWPHPLHVDDFCSNFLVACCCQPTFGRVGSGSSSRGWLGAVCQHLPLGHLQTCIEDLLADTV